MLGGKRLEKKTGKIKTVQSVERALSLLNLLAKEETAMRLSAISKETGLNISTVHRLLNTLIVYGFVEQEPQTGRYRLGIKCFEIGNKALYTLDIRSIAKPYLKRMVEKSNETANLVILVEGEVVYIDQVETHNIIKMFARPGTRGPSYCTGVGKVLLASLSEHEINRLAKGFNFYKYTDKTITDIDNLKKELAKIKEQGYSLDLGELEDDVRCVAAPIIDHEGKTIAAISLSGPYSRMPDKYLLEELVPLVKDTAGDISSHLGWNIKR
ncbi:MAG TPA: IclR family transcriptional regulator [Firmicutes bacterium]|nr:IclR family transcriptional regulator [Bacillota bacterium]